MKYYNYANISRIDLIAIHAGVFLCLFFETQTFKNNIAGTQYSSQNELLHNVTSQEWYGSNY